MLADRGKQAKTQIEEFKKRFGLGKKGRKSPLLTREEFEARRQAQIKALLGITADTKTDNHINEDGQ